MCLFLFSSCAKSPDKTWGEVSFSSPVKIIFDTDMLTDCDDAAALGILHKLADAGETEILVTMVTSLNNPVRRAYQLHRERAKNGHWNHHTADPSAVMLAVRGLSDYWDISGPGYLDIKPDCSFVWKNDPQGNQRYIIQKMDRVELGNLMETLMIMPPEKK